MWDRRLRVLPRWLTRYFFFFSFFLYCFIFILFIYLLLFFFYKFIIVNILMPSSQLPRPNRLVLMFLMKLLHDISLESDTNKMNCRNLSIVFGPNLIRGGRGREVAPSDLSEFPAKVVEVMIEKFSTIFARAEQEFQVFSFFFSFFSACNWFSLYSFPYSFL